MMVDGHAWAELSAGDEFAGYRIERRLGRGGMGILYLAIEPGLDRHVALKLIAPEAAADDVFSRRFAEESRIAASIEHPNVVPIYAAGAENGVPYIAMRFVSGSDLGQRISHQGKLEPERAAALIAQIGNGLDAIHAAGLVHRDVKPANVLVSGEEGSEHAYITDFGVARNVATQSGLTQTGRFVGTLDYVAPEQISGGAIDARVDVYALGCMLFKLLTGNVPFPREGEAARLYAHLNDPPPAPSLWAPEVSMALDDVVVRAMSKAPEDRYPSAGDLGRAAVAALSGAAVAVPERTVATGAAATREATTMKTEAQTRPSEVQAASQPREPTPPPTDSTRRLEPEPSTQAKPPSGSGPSAAVRRRRLALGGGLAALAAIVALVVVLSSGGGGGDGGGASTVADTTAREAREAEAEQRQQEATEKQQREQKKKVKEAAEKPLSETELIAKADALCAVNKDNFTKAGERFPEGETETNVPYSEELVANSSGALAKLERLVPPTSIESAYGRYLALQEEVHASDVKALKAARAGDLETYLQAREARNNMTPEREGVAREVGFEVCAIPGA
jgi:serine/threonine protein kinase